MRAPRGGSTGEKERDYEYYKESRHNTSTNVFVYAVFKRDCYSRRRRSKLRGSHTFEVSGEYGANHSVSGGARVYWQANVTAYVICRSLLKGILRTFSGSPGNSVNARYTIWRSVWRSGMPGLDEQERVFV